jgi:hypothetical protein
MLTELQNDALTIISRRPCGASELGRMLNIDRRQAGRLADRLAELGHAERRTNGNGFVYRGFGEARNPDQMAGHSNRPLDVPFRDVTEPSTSTALVPSGAGQPFDSRTEAAVRQHAEARRRDALRSPTGQAMGREVLRTWDGLYGATPGFANGFRAFDDDPAAEGSHAYDGLVFQAAQEGMAAISNAAAEREASLLGALKAKDDELAKVKSQADRDAMLAGFRRLSTPAALPEPAAKPRSLLAEAREARRIEVAEAAEVAWRDGLASAKRNFPPREYPELYSHLGPDDVPELFEDDDMVDDLDPAPRKSVNSLLSAKPNGHGAPPVTHTDEPAQDMPLSIKWGLAALGVGAIVAAIVRFPLR